MQNRGLRNGAREDDPFSSLELSRKSSEVDFELFQHLILLSTVAVCISAQAQGSTDSSPEPYQFAYSSQDKEGSSSHEESGDGSGKITGKYTLQLADGRMRVVTYWADESGFHADVMTNEQGKKRYRGRGISEQTTRGGLNIMCSRPFCGSRGIRLPMGYQSTARCRLFVLYGGAQ